MKKFVSKSLVLALTMLTLTGCGSSDSTEPTSTPTATPEVTSEATPEVTSEATPEVTSEATPEVTSEATPEVTSEATPEATPEASTEYERGSWDGNVFTSNFAGITFTMPEGFTALTDEELAQQMQLSVDLVKDSSAFNEALLKQTSIMDMMCKNDTSTSNFILMSENLSVMGKTSMEVETYLETMKTQLVEQGKTINAVYEIEETIADKTIGDNTYKVLSATLEASGVKMAQTYLVRKEGNFLISMIVSSLPEEHDALLNAIS